MITSTGFTRMGLATLGLCLTGVTLAGCSQAGGANAGGSASGTAQAIPLPALTLPAGSASAAVPTAAAPVATRVAAVAAAATTQAAPPPNPPAPTPSICPAAEFRFVHISAVGVDPATGLNDFTGELAEIQCGPGVEDDQQYVTIGQPVVYDVWANVTIKLVGNGNGPVDVTWAQFAASDLGEYGGYYGFDVNNGGLATVIDQYFHP